MGFKVELENILYTEPLRELLSTAIVTEIARYASTVTELPTFIPIPSPERRVSAIYHAVVDVLRHLIYSPLEGPQFRPLITRHTPDVYINSTTLTSWLDVKVISPRQIIRNSIKSPLLEDPRLVDRAAIYASDIETSIYNATVRFCTDNNVVYQRLWSEPRFIQLYSARCGEVLNALSSNSPTAKKWGTYTLDQLAAGTILPWQIGDLTCDQLNPHVSQAERDEIATRTNQKIMYKTSSLYRCPLCRKRETTYEEKQLRSLDEPATILCTCINCGHRFTGS